MSLVTLHCQRTLWVRRGGGGVVMGPSMDLGRVKARSMVGAHSSTVVVLGEGKMAIIIEYNTSRWRCLETSNHEIFHSFQRVGFI